MTHAELNKAIYTVITSRFKKDCAEAYKAVIAAGYSISKGDKTFCVENKATHRYIYLSENGYRTFLRYGWFECQKKRIDDDVDLFTFDYVNCLNTPVNHTWYEDVKHYAEQKPTMVKYDNLKYARWNNEYDQKQIDDLQKQIADLQKRLISAAQQAVRSEQKLKDVKRELGLIK